MVIQCSTCHNVKVKTVYNMELFVIQRQGGDTSAGWCEFSVRTMVCSRLTSPSLTPQSLTLRLRKLDRCR